MKRIFAVALIASVFWACSETVEKNVPDNFIFMISDGCGYNQIDVTNYYVYGEAGVQKYEQFPVRYGMSTYPADGEGYDPEAAESDFWYVFKNYTDSAASATALSSGVKTNKYNIGLDPEGQRLVSMSGYMKGLGKSAGVVTSVEFYHATPAGFSAHSDNRYEYSDIAYEMVFESGLDVIMGAGHALYDNDGNLRDEPCHTDSGSCTDGQVSEEVWTQIMSAADGSNPWTIIHDAEDFTGLIEGDAPARVLGIAKVFETLQYERPGDGPIPFEDAYNQGVPSLADMALGAINVLDNNSKGFFLMIEGGAVDWAGHDNNLVRLIEEQNDFNDAVDAVIGWIEANGGWKKNLLVVTADHETGYLAGPGSKAASELLPVKNKGKNALPGVEWNSDNHTNSLVPFFAKGSGSDTFKSFVKGTDPVRGEYIDNADIRPAAEKIFGK